MRAQLAAGGGDAAGALAVLRTLPGDSLRHQPAVVATVVRLQVPPPSTPGSAETPPDGYRRRDVLGKHLAHRIHWQCLVPSQISAQEFNTQIRIRTTGPIGADAAPRNIVCQSEPGTAAAPPRLSCQTVTGRLNVFNARCVVSSGGAGKRRLGGGGAQEEAGDMEAAVGTLEAALEWWRHSMSDAAGGGTRPEQWLLQRLVQVQPLRMCVKQCPGATRAVDMQV